MNPLHGVLKVHVYVTLSVRLMTTDSWLLCFPSAGQKRPSTSFSKDELPLQKRHSSWQSHEGKCTPFWFVLGLCHWVCSGTCTLGIWARTGNEAMLVIGACVVISAHQWIILWLFIKIQKPTQGCSVICLPLDCPSSTFLGRPEHPPTRNLHLVSVSESRAGHYLACMSYMYVCMVIHF